SELNVTGMHGVAAAFSASYQYLGAGQRRLFRLLATHPGRDVDCQSAANITGVSPILAEDLLQTLVDHHLLLEPSPGRYRFHELLRDYALTLTEQVGGTTAAPPHPRLASMSLYPRS
ncbi:hypothetical protein ACFQ1S_36955, partial [Kibdelosporangium lantanae]